MAAFVYPTIPNFHKDEPALDALADMMGGGTTLYFIKNLLNQKKLYKPLLVILALSYQVNF